MAKRKVKEKKKHRVYCTYFPDGRYYIGYSCKTDKQFEKYFGSSTIVKETVQAHLENQVDEWRNYDGDYEIIIVSVGMWYSLEDLDMLNDTFGDPSSDAHMPWIVATGDTDSVLKTDVIQSGVNSSEVDLGDGTYCIEAQVNNSEKEVSCFDIGQGLADNDGLDYDADGIEIVIQDNSSVNFTINTELEGNVTWDIVDVELSDAVLGCDEGLLEYIDPSLLPAGSDGTPAMQDFIPGSITDCAVGNIVWSTIFAYDFEKMPNGPKTMADFFDLDKFSDADSNLPHMALDPESFSKKIEVFGINPNCIVVVYDGLGLFSAARLLWLFHLYGFTNVFILDGGLPKWLSENRAVDSKIVMHEQCHFLTSYWSVSELINLVFKLCSVIFQFFIKPV